MAARCFSFLFLPPTAGRKKTPPCNFFGEECPIVVKQNLRQKTTGKAIPRGRYLKSETTISAASSFTFPKPMRHYLLLLFGLLTLLPLRAQQPEPVVITGRVIDAETGQPISGASIITTANRKKGTYSFGNGTFRLPLAAGEHELRVSSVGYQSLTQTVATGDRNIITFKLNSTSVRGREIVVRADLSAEQIVRRAIARRDHYRDSLRTFQGLIYSKLVVEIEGNAFGQLKDEDRGIAMETFSQSWYHREHGPRLTVIQRRQTANIPASNNLLALGNFFSFYDDELPLLNARVPTPMNESTLGRYNFAVTGKSTFGDAGVYIITVTPNSRTLPTFSGTIKILEGTFDLLEVDLKPSQSTAITFVKDLRLVQKFERFSDDVWQPTYLVVSGKMQVDIVQGIASLRPDFSITSIVSEATLNGPIPDSVFAEQRIITAAPDADSARSEFWENNALSELSPKEREIYRRTDSLVALTTTDLEKAAFSWDISPLVDFNRVASIMPRLNASARFGPFTAESEAAYSFKQKKPFGNLELQADLLDGAVTVEGRLFSEIAATTNDRGYGRVINTITAALLHRDYNDYMRHDGWSIGAAASAFGLTARGQFGISQQFLLSNTTDQSLFLERPFRPNPAIVEGSYRMVRGSVAWGNPDPVISISSSPSSDLDARISGFSGTESRSGKGVEGVEAGMRLELATIPTGYTPMFLRIGAYAGVGSDSLPTQYQFRMPTSNSIIGTPRGFYSAPVGQFGGTEYLELYAEHDFGDFFWRWVGLPTYEGRGLELMLTGAAGRFRQQASSGYRPTGDQWYTELGFAVGKIPTFISNVIFLRLDARWGVGPLGSGKFGAVVGISSPF